MTLRLVEAPAEEPRPKWRDIVVSEQPPAELRELARLLGITAGRVEDEHTERMLRAPLRFLRGMGCDEPEVHGLRLVGDGPEPDLLDQLDAVKAAAQTAIDGEFVNEIGAMCLRLVMDQISRHNARERQSRINEEVDLYFERYRESDLPGEPALRHGAKRSLVDAGIWKIEQLDDLERIGREVKGIGPKALGQLRAIREMR